MQLAEMPIAVVMQRRLVSHRCVDHAWSAVGVVPGNSDPKGIQVLEESESQRSYLCSGLLLSLYKDENDGYFENWAAPAPKVFIMWRLENDIAVPALASVSYLEGTRMLDSGEAADGVPMHPAIHEWLGAYLKVYYQPRSGKRRLHG